MGQRCYSQPKNMTDDSAGPVLERVRPWEERVSVPWQASQLRASQVHGLGICTHWPETAQQLCLSMFNICVYFFFVLSLVLFGWYSCNLPIYAAYFVSEWHVRHYCLLRKFRYSRFLSHGRLWPTENLYSQILPTTFFLGVKYTFLHENIRNGVETITLLP